MIEALDNLKERPRHELKSIAAWIAIVVVVILLLGWALLFFSKIRSSAVPTIVPVPQNAETASSSSLQL